MEIMIIIYQIQLNHIEFVQIFIPTNPNPTYANYATPIIPPQQVYYGQQPVYYAPVQQPQAQPIYNAQPQNDQYIPPPPSITGNENN